MSSNGVPVELHVDLGATGATATRLMQALEAQFPDQDFEEIHHPRAESRRRPAARSRSRQGPAGRGALHTRRRELRDDAPALPQRQAPLLRHPRPSDRGRRASVGPRREDAARSAAGARLEYFRRVAAIEFAVRYDDGWAAGWTRPRSSWSASRAPRRHRSRCTSATSVTRRRTCRSCRDRAAAGAVRDRAREDRRADDRGGAARRDPPERGRGWAARTATTRSCSRSTRSSSRPPPSTAASGARCSRSPELSIEETSHRIIRLVEQRRGEAAAQKAS